MTYEDMVAKVAESTGFDKKLVDDIYKAYWRAVRQHIMSLPLKEDLTDEEFLDLQPNVNIPRIGKLFVTLDRYHKIKKAISIAIEKKKQNEELDDTH